MPIDNHPLTQRGLQFTGIGVNKLTFKPDHGLQLWFPLLLHDGGSGLRLYDGSDVKL